MLALQRGDAARVRLRLLLLGRDQVRRALPDAVEPRDEDLHLGTARGLARVERRLGNAPLEPLDDGRRVAENLVAVDEHRHERLPAHRLDRGAVARIDVDPLELDALVAGCERDALDVRRERNPVDARCDTAMLALEPVLASEPDELERPS